jgi:hypothetical protein
MEWLSNFFIQEPIFLAIPFVIVVGILIYAARRAHFKYLERLKTIDDSYDPKATFQRR